MQSVYKFYGQFDKKSFTTIAIAIFIMCDILVIGHLYNNYSDRQIFSNSVDLVFTHGGVAKETIDTNMVENLYRMYHRTLVTILGFAAFFHLLMYAFFYWEKKIAISYAKFLASFGGVVLILWGLSLLLGGSIIGIAFGVMGTIAFSARYGLKHHFRAKNSEQ